MFLSFQQLLQILEYHYSDCCDDDAVFTLSSSFPMLSITLRNNLDTLVQHVQQKGDKTWALFSNLKCYSLCNKCSCWCLWYCWNSDAWAFIIPGCSSLDITGQEWVSANCAHFTCSCPTHFSQLHCRGKSINGNNLLLWNTHVIYNWSLRNDARKLHDWQVH